MFLLSCLFLQDYTLLESENKFPKKVFDRIGESVYYDTNEGGEANLGARVPSELFQKPEA